MSTHDETWRAIKTVAAEREVQLASFVRQSDLQPLWFGDPSTLEHGSLVSTMLGEPAAIERLIGYLLGNGSPRMFSQGKTTGMFGLLDGAVYGFFVDTSMNPVERYRLAKAIDREIRELVGSGPHTSV